MTLIYSMILCLFFKASSCQLQCVQETLNDEEFFINVTTHIEEESGKCIRIPYELTFPTNKVTIPYKKIWFRGDPQTTESEKIVSYVESGTKDIFSIKGLPQGEYEYGFRLEWECNQMYVFPKRVRISVSALTEKPNVWISPMTEGQPGSLQCHAPSLCSDRPTVYWKRMKADGSTELSDSDRGHRWFFRNLFKLTPTADDHNTKIACVAEFNYNIIETTVTLTVKFPPKIQNGSQCMVDGKLLVCVCISRGNPLPPITWPLASLTDFSVTSSSSDLTVHSIIKMPAAHYHNTSVKCISSNELDRAEIEIPLQNYTENLMLNYEKSSAVDAWIIVGVSLSLNLVLLTILIICKWSKSQKMELGEEMNTYGSLNRADVEQPYSVISPRAR